MADKIIGSAWVKIRALTDGLDKEIRDAFKDSKMDQAGKDLGKQLSDGMRDGVRDGMDGLNKELSDGLDEITKDIEKNKRIEVKVDPDIDEKNWGDKLDKATTSLAKDKDIKVEVHPHIDEQAWRNRILDGLLDLNELKEAKIKLDPEFDTDNLDRKIRQLADMLNQEDWEIDLDLNKTKLHHIEEQIKDMKNEVENDEIELSLSLGAISKKWVQGQLALLTRNRVVKIFTELDNKSFMKVMASISALSGLRMLDDTFTKLKDAFKNLDKNIPKIGAVAAAIGGIAAAALTGSSNILALASSLAEIVGVLIAAPGMAAGFAFGIGTMFAALKDWKNHLQDVSDQFSLLQDQISGNFWAIAEQHIRNMVEAVLPGLRDGFEVTSIALGNFAKQMSDAFREHLDADALRTMFENLAASIDITSQHADSFAEIIEILGNVGSSYLPRMARWFGDMSDKFAGWLDRNQRMGNLTKWMDLGIDRAKQLGSVVADAVKIIYNLGKIAEDAGGSSLDVLANTMGKIADVVSGEPFKTEMTKVFTAAHDAMTLAANQGGKAFSTMIQGLVPTLQNALPVVGQTLGYILEGVSNAINTSGFKEGLEGMLEGIRDGFEAASEYWVPLGEGLGALGDIIGSLAENFLPILGEALAAVSDIIVILAPTIETLSDHLSSGLSVALGVVTPLLKLLAEIIALIPAPIITALAGAFTALGLALKFEALAETNGLLKLLGGNLSSLPGFLQEAAVQAWMLGVNLKEVATGTASAKDVLPKLTKAVGFLTSPAGLAAGAVAALVGALEYSAQRQVVTKTAADFDLLVQKLDPTPQSMQNLNDAMGTMATVTEGADGKLYKMVTTFDEMGYAIEQSVPVHRESADAITDIGAALDVVVGHQDRGFWEHVFGAGDSLQLFGLHTGAMKQAKEDLAALDEALATAANSGNYQALGEMEKYIAEHMEATGMTMEEVTEAMPNYAQAQEVLAVQQERLAEKTKKAVEEQENFKRVAGEVGGLTPAVANLINEGSLAFVSLSDAAKAASTEVEGSNGEITVSFEKLMETLEAQVTAQANWADNMTELAGKVSEETLAELQKMGEEGAPLVAELATKSAEELKDFDELFQKASKGAADNMNTNFGRMNREMSAQLSAMNISAIDKTGEIEKTFTDAGVSVKDGYVVGLSTMGPDAAAELSKVDWRTVAGGDAVIEAFRSHGYDVVGGFVQGLGQGDIAGAGEAQIVGPIVSAVAGGLGIQSPSTVMAGFGADTVAGFVQGLSETESVTTAGTGIVDTLKSAFDGAEQFLFGDGEGSIKGFVKGALGIDTKTPGAKKRDEMGAALRDSDFRSQGTSKGNSFVNAFSAVNMTTPGNTAREKVRAALAAGDFGAQGTSKGNSFTRAFAALGYTSTGSTALGNMRDGLKSSGITNSIRSAGTAAGNAFKNNASQVDSFASGQSIGRKFANGISNTVGWVREAATKIANAARSVLPSSPAKEGPFSGKGWGGWGESIGNELAKGLLDKQRAVADAAGQLVGRANDELTSVQAMRAATVSVNEYMMALRSARAETGMSAMAANSYALAQQKNTAASYAASTAAQSTGSTVYNVNVTVDPKDLEGVKTVEQFVASAKLWTMM